MGNKITVFNEIKSIRIDINNTIDFKSPIIMGILNITPDSFYDGGSYSSIDDLIRKTETMIVQGADIIDIGAVSTRPGAEDVDENEELKRLISPLEKLVKEFPNTIFSIDTFRAKVAEETICAGAHIINDISGGTMDENMFQTIAKRNTPYILMHIHGTPQNMQQSPIENNIVSKVYDFFVSQTQKAEKLGATNLILDPGFGFGKSLESNYQLLRNIDKIRINKLPILAGISRKSIINKVLNTKAEEALNGTTSLNTIALLSGANILRVHDVKEAKQVVTIFNFMNKSIN